MNRRTKPQAELKPVYARTQLTSQQRADCAAWRRAAYTGARRRPKPGEFDPLQMRCGMRVNLVEQRAGWVVNNPLYDASLRRNPSTDPSLPGPGWLRELYRWNQHSDLTLLPRTRAAIEARRAARQAAECPPEAMTNTTTTAEHTTPEQMGLFA